MTGRTVRLGLPPGLAYTLGRVAQLVPTLLGVSAFAFLMIRASGDPTALLLAPDATEAERQMFRRAHGLDAPLPLQYVTFLRDLAHGDAGTSLWQHEPAMRVVLARFPATLQLALAAIAIVVLVGLPTGVVAAVRRASIVDRLTMMLVALGQSVATFWLGLMLILVFAVHWQWFPPSGYGTPAQLVLPALTLAAYYVAVTTRLTRSGMLEVLRHALRNALIPITTVLGLQAGELLAGAVVTETVFAWPGVGTLVLDAITRRDYPVVQAVVIVLGITYAVINLVVDLLYGALDPRIRFG